MKGDFQMFYEFRQMILIKSQLKGILFNCYIIKGNSSSPKHWNWR